MIKKLKIFLLLVLVVPISIFFSSCSCSGGGDNPGNNNTEQEQPGTDEPEEPPTPGNQTYTIEVDYNLPEKFSFLAENIDETLNVGESYTLPTISSDYIEYFTGWYYSSNDEEVQENQVSGTNGETISVYAGWNELNFTRYFSIGGFEYQLNEDAQTATIVGYDGTTERLVIPQVYVSNDINYSVNSISPNCFENSTVKEVITYTPNLSIGDYAFINSTLESIDFSNISYIGEYAFSGTNLISATFAVTLESIGESSFSNCVNLENVDFSGVQNAIGVLPNSVFEGCSSLKSVKLNNTIIEIGDYAFKNCTSISDLSFLNYSTLSTLGDNVFENCTALETATVFENIENLGQNIFEGCTNLKSIEISTIIFNLATVDNFSKYYGDLSQTLEEITIIGDNITSLPSNYFQDYIALKTFVMNDAITTISTNTFSGCVNLEFITFSANIDPIQFDISAFYDTKWYSNQTDIFVLNNVVVMVPETISGDVVIQDGVTAIVSGAFSNSDIESIMLPASLLTISNNVFANCSSLTEVIFAQNSNLETIGAYAFYRCSRLASINIENCTNLLTIDNYAFSGIGEIDEFVINASVNSIGTAVFSNSNISKFSVSLENENFVSDEDGVLFEKNVDGEKITLIAYPTSLTNEIYFLPETVTEIAERAFMRCNINLQYIYAYSQINIGNNAFLNAGTSGLITIISENSNVNLNINSNVIVYYMLDTEDYSVEEVDGEIEFTFNFQSLPQNFSEYFVSFVINNNTYYYLLDLSVIENEIVIESSVDVSNIFNNV